MSPAEQLARGLTALGLDLPESAQAKLLAYSALLTKWSKTFSLTALRKPRNRSAITCSTRWPSCRSSPPTTCSTLAAAAACRDSAGHRPPRSGGDVPRQRFRRPRFCNRRPSNWPCRAFPFCGRVEQYHPDKLFAAITSRAFAELADFVGVPTALLVMATGWPMKGVRPDDEIARLPSSVAVASIQRLAVPRSKRWSDHLRS